MKMFRFVLVFFLIFAVTGCQSNQKQESSTTIDTEVMDSDFKRSAMEIEVLCGDKKVIFQLNTSSASASLYDQLPLEVTVSDYGSNEKIFYPSSSLDTSDTPMAAGPKGTLAYFSPWGNIVMYYGSFGAYSGLYELGHAIEGEEFISELSGTIFINKVETN